MNLKTMIIWRKNPWQARKREIIYHSTSQTKFMKLIVHIRHKKLWKGTETKNKIKSNNISILANTKNMKNLKKFMDPTKLKNSLIFSPSKNITKKNKKSKIPNPTKWSLKRRIQRNLHLPQKNLKKIPW